MSSRILEGDVIRLLATLEDQSVHCVITSPPYWGLRDYGIAPSIWRGNPPWEGCLGLEPTPDLFVDHIVQVFRAVWRVLRNDGTLWLNMGDCYITSPYGDAHTFDPKYGGRNRGQGYRANRLGGKDCGLKSKDLVMMPARIAIALQSDGWYLRSQIPWLKRNGMPESAHDRPASMVEYIFEFSKSTNYYYDRDAVRLLQAEHERTRRLKEQKKGLDANYSLRRNDESHGQASPGRNGVARSSRARQELAVDGTRVRRNSDWFFESWQGMLTDDEGDPLAMIVNPQPFGLEMCEACKTCFSRSAYRNLQMDQDTEKRICKCGSRKWISHFATFSEKMVAPIISAATSEHGACSVCGAPYRRIVESGHYGDWHPNGARGHDQTEPNITARMATSRRTKNGDSVASIEKDPSSIYTPPKTIGWEASCSHPLFPGTLEPCVVLDPFGGSGTTAVVSETLGRNSIMIERNPLYVEMIKQRVSLASLQLVTSREHPSL